MRQIKYFTLLGLANLSSATNYCRPQHSPNNFNIEQNFFSDGKDLVVGVAVHKIDPKYNWNDTTNHSQPDYQSADAQFFNILDMSISATLESRYACDPSLSDYSFNVISNNSSQDTSQNESMNQREFSAHYIGQKTNYFNKSDGEKAELKGGNLLISTGNVHYFWEGDPEACANIEINGYDIDDPNYKRGICTFEKAREYCHRHGGELILPDQYFWKYIFHPMCNGATGNVHQFAHANVFGDTLTNTNFWINLQKIPIIELGDWRIDTTAKIHFFSLLDHKNNQYVGTNFDNQLLYYNQTMQTLIDSIDDPDYSDVMRNRFGNDLDDDGNPLDRSRKIDDSELSQTEYARLISNMVDHAVENNSPFDTNMQFMTKKLRANGFGQRCMSLQCQVLAEENIEIQEPALNDETCDNNNNLPLCITEPLIHQSRVCPGQIMQSNEDPQCGDNVYQLLVGSLWGALDRESEIYVWGKPYGKSMKKPMASYNDEMFETNAILTIREILMTKFNGWKANNSFDGSLEEFLSSHEKSNVLLYTNCMGEFDRQLNKWSLADENTRNYCSRYGYVYDNNGHPLVYDNQHNSLSCPCVFPDPPLPPLNGLPVAQSNVTHQIFGRSLPSDSLEEENLDFFQPILSSLDLEYCCPVSYTWDDFSFDDSDFYNKVSNSNEPQCTQKCVRMIGQDEILYDDELHHKNFWDDGFFGGKIDDNGNAAFVKGNTKKVFRFRESMTVLTENQLSGACNLPQCDAPTEPVQPDFEFPGVDLNSLQWHNNNQTYFLGSNLTIGCLPGYCGKASLKCTEVCPKSSWSIFESECAPVRCQKPEEPVNGKIIRINDQKFEVSCDDGYELYDSTIDESIDDIFRFISCDSINNGGDCIMPTIQPYHCQLIKTCSAPGVIPHGKVIHSKFRDSEPISDGTIRPVVGQWVRYQCDQDYQLSFTDTGESVTDQSHCARQCHISRPNINNTSNNSTVVLDPMNCYCKMQVCEPVQPASKFNQYLIDEDRINDFTYYPSKYATGFDKIHVKCKNQKFSQLSGKSHSETLNCNPDWTTATTCIELGCINPRTHAGQNAIFYHPSLSTKHTCASLDAIKLPGKDQNWSNLPDALSIPNQNQIIFAPNPEDQNSDQLTFSLNSYDDLATDWENDLANPLRMIIAKDETTVTEGAKLRFTCKKGFVARPNSKVFMEGYKVENRLTDHFDCICMNGRWECNHFCQSYCG